MIGDGGEYAGSVSAQGLPGSVIRIRALYLLKVSGGYRREIIRFAL